MDKIQERAELDPDQGQEHGITIDGKLRKIAGLGVNIMQVYQDAKCYLKGIFNAIEAFRSDRDSQGWRVKAAVNSAAFLDYSVGRSVKSPLDLPGEYPLETKPLRCYYTWRPSRSFF